MAKELGGLGNILSAIMDRLSKDKPQSAPSPENPSSDAGPIACMTLINPDTGIGTSFGFPTKEASERAFSAIFANATHTRMLKIPAFKMTEHFLSDEEMAAQRAAFEEEQRVKASFFANTETQWM